MSLKVKRRSVMSFATCSMASLSGLLLAMPSTMSKAKLNSSSCAKWSSLRLPSSFSTGWTKCEHRSCSGWTSSTARGRTTMACSSSVLAMIMARKVQSAPSTAIMPWGVELL